ncbi:cupin domain-containing protein [Bradyrhizobium elkanii]
MELRELIAPVPPEQFFNRFWEKEVLYVSRNDVAYFPFLRAEQSLEEIIQFFCRQWGDVSLARAGTPASECPYLNAPPDLRAITKAFREKYTVVVNDLQLKDLSVAHLCRSIERAFFCRANVNAYLTNADSQGLKAHYDDDDVFILQLKGTKSWKIYRERVDLPLASMAYAERLTLDSPFDGFELVPGDVLYMPRGVIHEAIAGAVPSLHLTVSLSTLRWIDVINEVVQATAERDVRLRRSIAPQVLRGIEEDRAEIRAELRRLVEHLLDSDATDQAIHRLQNRICRGLGPVSLVSLAATAVQAPLTGDCRLQLAPDQICCVEEDNGSCKLKAVGAEFEFPLSLSELPRFMCSVDQFCPNELPGALSPKARLEVAQQFLDRGLVVRAPLARAVRQTELSSWTTRIKE